MTQEIIMRIKLVADDGMCMTNGKEFLKTVLLGSWDDPENWYEITEEEAQIRMAKMEEELMNQGE